MLLLIAGALSVTGQEDNKKSIIGRQIYSQYDPNAPSQKQNKLQLGLEYYRNQEYDKSAVLFEWLYENEPNHTHYTYFLYSLIGTKDYRGAEKLVKRQIKIYPDNTRYMVDQGFLYVTLGEVKKGMKIYRNAIEGLPADQRAIKSLASSFIGKRENDLALKTYMKGRELLSGTYGFENELAALYNRMQQYDKMIETYLLLASKNPSQITNVQNRIQYYLSTDDSDGEIHEALRLQLLRNVQAKPDERFYADFLLWLSIQEKDYEMALLQAKALDKRFDRTGAIVFNIATLSTAAEKFDIAEEAFNYILSRYKDEPIYESSLSGYAHSKYKNFTLQQTYSEADVQEIRQSLEEVTQKLEIGNISITNYRDLAGFYCYYDKTPEKGIEILNILLENRRIKPASRHEIKLDLADIYLYSGDPWEATLLLSQVEKANKNEPVGHEAKLRNARLSYYIGEYGWAEGQLNILKAATSKLIANDAMNLFLFIKDNKDSDTLSPALDAFAKAELMIFRHRYKEAENILDSLYLSSSTHAIADDILFKKAEIAEKNNNTILADSLYEQVYTWFPESILADDAIMRRITIAERNGDKDNVASLNEKILFEYPASIFAVQARQDFRAYIEQKKEEEFIPLPQTEK